MLTTILLYLFLGPANANELPCTQEEIQIACTANNKMEKSKCVLPDDFKTNNSQYCSKNTEASKPSLEPLQTEKTPTRIGDHKSTVSMKTAPAEHNKTELQNDTAAPSTFTMTNIVSFIFGLIGLFVAGFSLLQGKKKMSNYQDIINSLNQKLEKQAITLQEMQAKIQLHETESHSLQEKVDELQTALSKSTAPNKKLSNKQSGVSLGSSTKKSKGLSLGNQNKQTSDSKPPLVNSFTKLLNFWSTESESISKLVPSADDFNKRVIQHSQHFLDKLE